MAISKKVQKIVAIIILTSLLSSLYYFEWRVYGRVSYYRVIGPDERPRIKQNLTIQCASGRLGNQMFVYATLYSISKLSGRQGVVPKCCANYLRNVFRFSLPVEDDEIPPDLQVPYPIYINVTREQMEDVPDQVNLVTGSSYKNNINYFKYTQDDVKREFKFETNLLNFADSFLNKIRMKRPKAVFVGVHVRRSDYTTGYLKRVNLEEAGSNFYRKAFEYFRNRTENAVFVVVSDDITWCQKNFHSKDIYFQWNRNVSPGHDLALMSRCNHSVIDYGTFGWWGAYLAGGETVYFNNPRNGSVAKDPFYLDKWTAINQS